jgi:hypothetical protein
METLSESVTYTKTQSHEVLYNKDGTQIFKLPNNCFRICFFLQNKNIMLNSILNFDLIKLVHDLNKDVCENIETQKLDESNAIVTLLIKNFFEDLGIPQKYSCLQIHKQHFTNDHHNVVFVFSTFTNYKASWLPEDLELACVDEIRLHCYYTNPHHVNFDCNIRFPNNHNLPAFVQKMSVMIVHKIINRLKQFIENVQINI